MLCTKAGCGGRANLQCWDAAAAQAVPKVAQLHRMSQRHRSYVPQVQMRCTAGIDEMYYRQNMREHQHRQSVFFLPGTTGGAAVSGSKYGAGSEGDCCQRRLLWPLVLTTAILALVWQWHGPMAITASL
eukprot:359779-Chlamydomonas_euryale.AAC.3